MRSHTIINFRVPLDKKQSYVDACKILGTSISEICRKALDEAVNLSSTVKSAQEKMEKIESVGTEPKEATSQ